MSHVHDALRQCAGSLIYTAPRLRGKLFTVDFSRSRCRMNEDAGTRRVSISKFKSNGIVDELYCDNFGKFTPNWNAVAYSSRYRYYRKLTSFCIRLFEKRKRNDAYLFLGWKFRINVWRYFLIKIYPDRHRRFILFVVNYYARSNFSYETSSRVWRAVITIRVFK